MFLSRAPRVPDVADRIVLGVGSRVIVTCGNGRAGEVTLTDDDGTSAVATVAGGVEVEILAWRPRRGSETRYRVVSTMGGVEGWLGAKSLRPRPTPPPARRVQTAEPAPRTARAGASPVPSASKRANDAGKRGTQRPRAKDVR
jgi:hypothetical protein